MGRRNSNATAVRTRPRHRQALKSNEAIYLKYGAIILRDMRILADNGDGTVKVGPAFMSPDYPVQPSLRAVPLSDIYYGTPGA